MKFIIPSMSKKTLQLLQKAKSKSQDAKMYCKVFALPNLKISTFYQNYSPDIKKVFLEIFSKLEVSQKMQDLLAGKIVNHSRVFLLSFLQCIFRVVKACLVLQKKQLSLSMPAVLE
jgi:hypothetical protein